MDARFERLGWFIEVRACVPWICLGTVSKIVVYD